MRAYVISTLFNKLFIFECIIIQALITIEITEMTVIKTYKIEVFK